MTRLLSELAGTSADFIDEEKWEKCFNEIKWWNDFFLESGTGQEIDINDEAFLLKLLRQCPCSLADVIIVAIEEIKGLGYSFQPEVLLPTNNEIQVFCDKELLKTCLKQVIQNACKHVPQEKIGSHTLRIQWSKDKSSNESENIILSVKNDKTDEKVSRGKGRGIASANQKLQGFGGSIEGNPIKTD